MRVLFGVAAAILLVACSPGTQTNIPESIAKAPPKGEATDTTRAANAAVADRLPLEDTSDFVDATRGLLAQLKQDTITDVETLTDAIRVRHQP